MSIVEKHNYIDVARTFKVENLLNFFIAAALEKWAGYRDGAEIMVSIGRLREYCQSDLPVFGSTDVTTYFKISCI